MSLEAKVQKQLAQALESVDEQSTRGPRLVDDARRLWQRLSRLVAMDLVAEPDLPALELACWALSFRCGR